MGNRLQNHYRVYTAPADINAKIRGQRTGRSADFKEFSHVAFIKADMVRKQATRGTAKYGMGEIGCCSLL